MRCIIRLLLILSFISLFLSDAQAFEIKQAETITVSVFVSPDSSFSTSKTFAKKSKLIRQLTQSRTIPATADPSWIRATLTVKKRSYLYDHDGRLFTADKKKLLLLPKQAAAQIETCVRKVEQQHYGSLTPWNEVKLSFQRKDYATVVDLETGKRFNVQRRAGSRHADVQPLTKRDTSIMKEIYQGKWSWKRRAIRVEVDGKSFAASMHGMPHGAGAIRGNAFPGHFCIHFYGSSTHRRRDPDPSHSLMITKAAGILPQTLMAATPEEIVSYFLTSLNEHDFHTLGMLTADNPLPDELQAVDTLIRPLPVSFSEGDLLVEATLLAEYFTNEGKSQKELWRVVLQRFSPWERWKITHVETNE